MISGNDRSGAGPTFFLIGAPKAGTTALARYLSEHPAVFVSSPKEPNFFARHLTIGPRPTYQQTLEGYLQLFSEVNPGHLAVGEGSTRYLRSPEALDQIRDFCPAAKLIVMLRDPVSLVQSWHAQKLLERQETEPSLPRAWLLQEHRRRGESLPKGLQARDALDYGGVASVGTQLQRVYSIFPASQVYVGFFDDLRINPRGTYESILEFLNVPSDDREEFPVVNVRRRRRLFGRLFGRPGGPAGVIGKSLGAALRDRSPRLYRELKSWMTTPAPAHQLAPQFLSALLEYFESEIQLVERLTGRDLAAWRMPR